MKISYAKIESECNQMHNIANKMNENVAVIKRLNNNLSYYWKGIGCTNYQSKMRSALQNFDAVYQELESCVLYLAKCAEGYKAIDQQVMNQICNNLKITSPNLSRSKIFIN